MVSILGFFGFGVRDGNREMGLGGGIWKRLLVVCLGGSLGGGRDLGKAYMSSGPSSNSAFRFFDCVREML